MKIKTLSYLSLEGKQQQQQELTLHVANTLEGTIPNQIGELEHLNVLHLYQNKISGTLFYALF